MNQTSFDFPRNMANIYEAIRIAVAEGSDILALEELGLTGYDAGDDFQKTDNNKILASLEDIAAYAKALDPNLIISVGHPWRFAQKNIIAQPEQQAERVKDPLYNRIGLPFNVQTIIAGGEIQGMTAKANLFNYERGYEKRYFEEWSTISADRAGGVFGTITVPLSSEPAARQVPFGRPIFHVSDGENGFNLSQAICEEKWVATRYDDTGLGEGNYPWDNIIPSISRRLRGKDGLVLLVADASPPAPDKIQKHEFLVSLASQYANAVINTDGLGSSGSTFAQFGHRLMAQDGKIISSGVRISFNRVAATTRTIEINAAPARGLKFTHATFAHTFTDRGALAPQIARPAGWDRPDNPNRQYEETVRMTALWLFDYLQKVHSSGIAQALSGGKDSAFNSVIVAAMVHLAVKDLGVEGFCKAMSHMPFTDKILDANRRGGEATAIREAIDHMLSDAYMGTDNSSDATRNAARYLIEGGPGVPGIGGKYIEYNVQDLLDFYGVVYAVDNTTTLTPERKAALWKDVAAHLNKRPGSVSLADLKLEAETLKQKYPEISRLASVANPAELVAYENIQARARQVLIMMIANVEGKMAVANPNLDEARNAYATFGGDLHAGTINLNGHLDKEYEVEVMQYLYKHGLEGVMAPVRSLGPVLGNKPSAELQPKNEKGEVVQNDEDALKGSFKQLRQFARYMLREQVKTPNGPRRLNAGEIFERCKTDPLFTGLSDETLYEMISFRYRRWGIAQHKIHASPVTPTYGENVDHQVSLRTPNLNGGSKDELTLLGVKLLFNRAAREGITWFADRVLLEKRAQQDEIFIRQFEKSLRNPGKGLDFDLAGLYERINTEGWNKIFPPLPVDHPIMVIHATQNKPAP